MSYPQVFDCPARQALYEQARDKGTSHKLAESLASWYRNPGQTVGISGSNVALNERSANRDPLEGVDKRHRAYVEQKLREGGVTSLSGKRYYAGLARYSGDPQAVQDDRGDMKRLLEKRGWGSEGMVNTKVRERSIPRSHELGKYTVSDKIVDREMRKEHVANPDMAAEHKAHAKKRKAHREALKERLSGRG